MTDTIATAPAAPVNAAIRAAQDVPSLVANIKAVDPGLADQLTDKALVYSKTPWGTLAVAGVSWLASRYGLGWSPEVCALVGALGLLVGSYTMRYVSSSPIGGLFSVGRA